MFASKSPSPCENWATKDETTIRGIMLSFTVSSVSKWQQVCPPRPNGQCCWVQWHLQDVSSVAVLGKPPNDHHLEIWDTLRYILHLYKNQYLSSGLFGGFLYEYFTIWMWLLLWGRTPTPTPCLASLKASMNSITVSHCLSPGSCLLSEDLAKPTVKSCKVNLAQSSPKDLRRVLGVYIYILQICIKYVAHHSPACWSLIHESASGVNCSG